MIGMTSLIVRRVALCFMLAGSIGTLSVSVFAQEKGSDFSMTVAKDVFSVGEPVNVRLTLYNSGGETLKFSAMNLRTQTMRYTIKAEDGTLQELGSSLVTDPTALLEIPPGKYYYNNEILHFNYETNRLVFPTPGNYTIQAEYTGPFSKNLGLQPVEVRIKVVSASPADEGAADLFSRKEMASFMNGTSGDEATIQHTKDLIYDYPQSLFSVYARYYLAMYMARDLSGKPPDLEEAILLLRDADKDGFQLQPEVLMYLGQWSWELGLTAEASDYFSRVIKMFPDTVAGRTAKEMKEKESRGIKPAMIARPYKPGNLLETINGYFNDFERFDVAGCLSWLDEGFRYNDRLNKNSMKAQIEEDIGKIKKQGKKFNIQREISRIEIIGGKPVVGIDILFMIDGKPLSNHVKVRLELRENKGRWFFTKWNEVK